ncbi:Gluconolactonase [Cyphellophora attinorum]|uniref:Gluconolactonase n=1 Tax=Cyphellophora attinorum TaxID=1664694 RepID=A0A0N1H6B6_9EURO|nr:Gluconolactonase [Phialophora attinorum]KPI37663.1 Gluconolactonase [Phialophora attinorum]
MSPATPSSRTHKSLSMAQLALLIAGAASQGLKIGPSIVEVSPDFNSVFPFNNFNRNVSVASWQTNLLNGTSAEVNEDLEFLANATFITYDESFYELLGVNSYEDIKEIETIFTFPPPPSYAQRQIHDGTVYIPETDTIFFAELYSPKPGAYMHAIPFVWQISNASTTSATASKAYPSPALTIANGAHYHNGSVYWAQEGNWSTPGGLVRMDPFTLKTEPVQNNFYGHRFNSPNDVVVSDTGRAYFTDGYYGRDNFKDSLEPELANGVYRWDLQTGNIRMVAGAADGTLFNPNGVAFNAEQTRLFVTMRGFASGDADGGRTMFAYDITENGLANRQVFAYVDSGFPDGIKTDKDGRVYGAVTGSVDVFDEYGTLLGRIKVDKDDVAVNMVWVGDHLYIVGRNKVYRVQLNTKER